MWPFGHFNRPYVCINFVILCNVNTADLGLFRGNNSCPLRRKHIGAVNCQRMTGNMDGSYQLS